MSLAKAGGEMNPTSKSELIGILTDGFDISLDLPESEIPTGVLMDGHALIQKLGKPPGCQTFGPEYSWNMF